MKELVLTNYNNAQSDQIWELLFCFDDTLYKVTEDKIYIHEDIYEYILFHIENKYKLCQGYYCTRVHDVDSVFYEIEIIFKKVFLSRIFDTHKRTIIINDETEVISSLDSNYVLFTVKYFDFVKGKFGI